MGDSDEAHAGLLRVVGTWDNADMSCRVYWGSHACTHDRGHAGPHECDCCDCVSHPDPIETAGHHCVAKPPYFGPQTLFYGDEAEAEGLATLS